MRDATHKADKMVVLHKSLAENYIKISSGFMDLSALDETNRGSDDKVSTFFNITISVKLFAIRTYLVRTINLQL